MHTVFVAVWNSTMSANSFFGKTDAFENWLNFLNFKAPTFLVLLEASGTMIDYSHIHEAGFDQIGWVDTQAKGGGTGEKPIAKSIVAFARKGKLRSGVEIEPTKGQTLMFPELKQTRAALKISVTTDGSTLTMWFMHANASDVGGAAAVAAVENYLAHNHRSVVFADFNLKIEDAKKTAGKDVVIVHPVGPKHRELIFTNWNDKGFSCPSHDTLVSWGVDKNTTINKTIKTFGVIDYAMHSKDVTVTACPNAKDGVMLGSLLAQFDHFPTIYEVDWT